MERSSRLSAIEQSGFSPFVALIAVPVVMGYLLTLPREASCPADSFWSGTDLPIGAFEVGLFSCLFSTMLFVLVASSLLASPERVALYVGVQRIVRHWQALAASGCVLAVLAIGARVVVGRSFHCVSPDAIILGNALDGDRTYRWSDLASVTATCFVGRHARFADLALDFPEGRSVRLGFQTTDTAKFAQLRAALAPLAYSYVVDPSVRPDACPSGVYPVLAARLRPG